MHSFSVWAPNAKRVEVEVSRVRIPMKPAPDGWWLAEIASAEAGSEYAFVLDDGEPLPDPRSSWQPRGVTGPSRIVDHRAFSWTDRNWQPRPLSAAVIYELHIGTFTPAGTFKSTIERLDSLVDLGITHVELMPVAEFPGDRGWGYDGVDLYAPHHAYGTPNDLKLLVDACHGRGLAVILDVVYNHLGPAGNHLARFGPYFTERYATPWGPAVNFDGPCSDEVRRFFCDNALMWLRDYHFDGLRLDAVHAIIDGSAFHFLEQLACALKELEAETGRHLFLIAESDLNDPRIIRASAVGGYGIDAQWNDDFHHALHTVLTGEQDGYYVDFGSIEDLAKTLKNGFVYDYRYSKFRQRHFGRPRVSLSGDCLVGYAQNHDQIGNRANGERISHLVHMGKIKIAAALVLASPFVPMLFQGEEWGASSRFLYFTNHQDVELGRAVTEGRRREFATFGWEPSEVPDPQASATFEASKLNWDERQNDPHADILAWHKALIRLRREEPALTDGRLDRTQVTFDEAAQWLILRRGPIAVACNLGASSATLPLVPDQELEILLASDRRIRLCHGNVELVPDSVAIVRTRAARDCCRTDDSAAD
ncbi:MAG TPA: malto-oligosyltrehalose trehalohydrolase [Candidatus Binatia bacterium]